MTARESQLRSRQWLGQLAHYRPLLTRALARPGAAHLEQEIVWLTHKLDSLLTLQADPPTPACPQ